MTIYDYYPNRRRAHVCDAACVCPIHGTPLIYSRRFDDHACQRIDCVHAHGISVVDASDAVISPHDYVSPVDLIDLPCAFPGCGVRAGQHPTSEEMTRDA